MRLSSGTNSTCRRRSGVLCLSAPRGPAAARAGPCGQTGIGTVPFCPLFSPVQDPGPRGRERHVWQWRWHRSPGSPATTWAWQSAAGRGAFSPPGLSPCGGGSWPLAWCRTILCPVSPPAGHLASIRPHLQGGREWPGATCGDVAPAPPGCEVAVRPARPPHSLWRAPWPPQLGSPYSCPCPWFRL